MSLQAKILNLVSGIDDPAARIEIARTIKFLYEVYMHGVGSPEEVEKSLMEVAMVIVDFKEPELSEDEKKEKAKKIVEDIMRSFRMEAMYLRTQKMFRARLISHGGLF